MLQNVNEKLEPDYKRWVVDGICMPQIAASLILGINPDICIIKDRSNWQNVTIRVKEVQQVSYVLCDGGRPWDLFNHLTIFEHVETALKNRIEISEGLLAEINQYFTNYIDKDKEKFISNHPYLARALNQPLNQKIKQEPQTSITEKERPQVLQMLLGMAMDAYNYIPGATKNVATGSKHGSIRAALQSKGLDVTEDTIRKYLNEAVEMFPEVKVPNA